MVLCTVDVKEANLLGNRYLPPIGKHARNGGKTLA